MADVHIQSCLLVQEEYGRSNTLKVIGSGDHGNSSQFLLVRRPRADSTGNATNSANHVDWCFVVGAWELEAIAAQAAKLLARMNSLAQVSYSMGYDSHTLVGLKGQDNSGNWKFYIDFQDQKPLAHSCGRHDRWRTYFSDAADLADFVGLLARIRIDVGRFGGYLPIEVWPIPCAERALDHYIIISEKIEAADECHELDDVVTCLRQMGEGCATFGDPMEQRLWIKSEIATCIDCARKFERPYGQGWRKRCYECWKTSVGRAGQ